MLIMFTLQLFLVDWTVRYRTQLFLHIQVAALLLPTPQPWLSLHIQSIVPKMQVKPRQQHLPILGNRLYRHKHLRQILIQDNNQSLIVHRLKEYPIIIFKLIHSQPQVLIAHHLQKVEEHNNPQE